MTTNLLSQYPNPAGASEFSRNYAPGMLGGTQAGQASHAAFSTPGRNAAISGIAGGIASMFGPNPWSAAQPYMDGAMGDIKSATADAQKRLNPYEKAGEASLAQYQAMLARGANPSQFYNQLMSSFRQSPAQQYAEKQGLNAISQNAATKGLLGSGQMAKELQAYGQNITGQQQQQYLGNLLGMYNRSMAGYGGLAGRGQQAAAQQGAYGMQGAHDEAELQEAEAQAAAAQASSDDSGIGDLISGAASILF